MKTLDDRRRELEMRRDDLVERMRNIDAELDSHSSTRDWEELSIEREEDEVLEGMGRSSLAELRRIEAALARMDAGEYGFCLKCGTPISEDRLDLLPETPHCRDCAP